MTITAKPSPPLPLSPTMLKTYLDCPWRYYSQYVLKNTLKESSPALVLGNKVHKSIENNLTKNEPLCDEAKAAEGEVQVVREFACKPNVDMHVESRLAITREGEPTSFFGRGDSTPWLRGIADVLMVDHNTHTNIIIDWKTGKVQDSTMQEEMLALCASRLTGYTKTLTMWVYTRVGEVTINKRDLSNINCIATTLKAVHSYEESCAKGSFPMRTSGLCGKWCPAIHCPYNGKGK